MHHLAEKGIVWILHGWPKFRYSRLHYLVPNRAQISFLYIYIYIYFKKHFLLWVLPVCLFCRRWRVVIQTKPQYTIEWNRQVLDDQQLPNSPPPLYIRLFLGCRHHKQESLQLTGSKAEIAVEELPFQKLSRHRHLVNQRSSI